MAKRKPQPETIPFSNFVRAAVFDPPLARKMIRDNPQWLTAMSATGETALADVVIENYGEAARFLIECGADINTRDHSGETPLMQAAQLGYQEMVALLLEHGADVSARDITQETALFKAARYGYAEVCTTLLEAGVDAKARNMLGETALDVILPRKRSLLLSVFEKHGFREPTA